MVKISNHVLLLVILAIISSASSGSYCPDSKIESEIIKDVNMSPVEILIKYETHIMLYAKEMETIQHFHVTPYAQEFLKFLTYDDSLKRKEFSNYAGAIIQYSRGRHRHIHDPVLFSILVSMFRHGDEEVLYYITEHGRRDYLNAFSEYIKPHLFEKKTFSELPFYKLTAQEKELILSKPISVSIRAALGDTIAENKIIEQFQNAKGFNAKLSSAKQLSYIGTRKSLHELVSSFEDTLTSLRHGSRESYRYHLIVALADIFPENCLFYDIMYNYEGDASYSKQELSEYAQKIENWVKDKFSIKIDLQKFIQKDELFLIKYLPIPKVER